MVWPTESPVLGGSGYEKGNQTENTVLEETTEYPVVWDVGGQ